MAITSTGLNAATSAEYKAPKENIDKTKLQKDDFLKLLLVELQHQDPTEPMDSEKILNQTSQLATLESSKNTTKALEELSSSMQSSKEFSTIAAIGKTANLGSDAISHEEGKDATFEIYFSNDASHGSVEIIDADGNVVSSIKIKTDEETGILANGVHKFSWNGLDNAGNPVDGGIYHVKANYTNTDGKTHTDKLGTYPIESVKFQDGKSLLKLGSSYVPLEKIVEVY
jgi:flagellar basal-body rod modification protein FlgD